MAKALIDMVKNTFADHVVHTHSRLGNDTVVVSRDVIADVIAFLRDHDDAQMNLLRDITAVDYLNRKPRFDVVYVLYSIAKKHMLTIRVGLAEDDVALPTISHLYGCAAWMEREVFDMYGMEFRGHPDLRRVLLYDEFEGHPLRKDYATQASQPRTELLAPERDAVEEFLKHMKDDESASGSRAND